jgi:hypothetical protein
MWGKSSFPRIPQFTSKPLQIISRMLSRVLLTLFEYPAIEDIFKVRRMLKHEDRYDLMISFAVPYPVQWGVAWSRSKNSIAKTWIGDCGDPYMGDVLDSFKKPFYFGYLEKAFFKRADFITIPVESARSGYYPEFHHKIHIIPQGFNFDLNLASAGKVKNNLVEFAYAGGFLQGIRDPGLLLQFLTKVTIPFRFYVFTNQPELLNGYKEKFEDKLVISGYVKREELLNKLSQMDFLINFDNNTPLNVPSKLIDYAIINRPVLNIDKTFSFEDLLAFLNGNYDRKMELPDPDQYHIKNVSQKFLNLVKS